jgi:hypothetical protein
VYNGHKETAFREMAALQPQLESEDWQAEKSGNIQFKEGCNRA